MKHRLLVLLAAAALPTTLALATARAGDATSVTLPPAAKKAVPTELYEVEKVVDGDTIHIQRRGKLEKLRLLSVDTEEKMGSGTSAAGTKPPTVFGEECAQWAQGFFAALAKPGEKPKVGLSFPGGKEEYDFFGRLLCHVILPDGTDYNLMIVEMGKSPYFTKYGFDLDDHEAFVAAQRNAQKAQRGIWDPKTNQASTPGTPSAGRPYDKLVPWWDARGAAVQSWRDAQQKDASKVCDVEDADALAAAARSGEVVDCFGEIAKVDEKPDGAMTVHFRARQRDKAFVVFVPASAHAVLAPVDLPGTAQEFRQNYVWFKTRVTADPKGYFKAESETADAWRRAGPEPRLPAPKEAEKAQPAGH